MYLSCHDYRCREITLVITKNKVCHLRWLYGCIISRAWNTAWIHRHGKRRGYQCAPLALSRACITRVMSATSAPIISMLVCYHKGLREIKHEHNVRRGESCIISLRARDTRNRGNRVRYTYSNEYYISEIENELHVHTLMGTCGRHLPTSITSLQMCNYTTYTHIYIYIYAHTKMCMSEHQSSTHIQTHTHTCVQSHLIFSSRIHVLSIPSFVLLHPCINVIPCVRMCVCTYVYISVYACTYIHISGRSSVPSFVLFHTCTHMPCTFWPAKITPCVATKISLVDLHTHLCWIPHNEDM